MPESKLPVTFLDREMRKSCVSPVYYLQLNTLICDVSQFHPVPEAHHRKCADDLPVSAIEPDYSVFQDNNLIPKSVEVKHQNISIVVCQCHHRLTCCP